MGDDLDSVEERLEDLKSSKQTLEQQLQEAQQEIRSKERHIAELEQAEDRAEMISSSKRDIEKYLDDAKAEIKSRDNEIRKLEGTLFITSRSEEPDLKFITVSTAVSIAVLSACTCPDNWTVLPGA